MCLNPLIELEFTSCILEEFWFCYSTAHNFSLVSGNKWASSIFKNCLQIVNRQETSWPHIESIGSSFVHITGLVISCDLTSRKKVWGFLCLKKKKAHCWCCGWSSWQAGFALEGLALLSSHFLYSLLFCSPFSMIKDFLVGHVSHTILIYTNVSEENLASGTMQLHALVSCIVLVLPAPVWNFFQAFDLKNTGVEMKRGVGI